MASADEIMGEDQEISPHRGGDDHRKRGVQIARMCRKKSVVASITMPETKSQRICPTSTCKKSVAKG
jgi:hypothetical protein